MATTRVVQPISIYRQEGKDGVIVSKDPGEEASMSYKAGAVLVQDGSSAELEEWAGGTNSSKIVGVAAKDATGTTGADVPYYEANGYNLFAVNLINGTDAIALAASHIGVAYSLVKSGNNWLVDVADTTTTVVTVVEPIDPIGDSNARVAVRFIQANRAKEL